MKTFPSSHRPGLLLAAFLLAAVASPTALGEPKGLNGSFTVLQSTFPSDSSQRFDYAGDAAGSIRNGQQITVGNVPPGQYTTAQLTPSGWELLTIECDDDDSSGDVPSAVATFRIDPGEEVTCVFHNSLPVGSVGGTVSGLEGTGLVLQNNGGDDLPILANGEFTFDTPILEGTEYAVTVLARPVQPSQSCQVGNGSGLLGAGDVTDITVQCSTDVADLAISKDDGADIIVAGEPISYVIEVSNAGPLGVTGARVRDVLPSELASGSWECVPGAGASCPVSGDGGIDELVDIPAGSSVTFVLTASTPIGFVGSITNTASVTVPDDRTDDDPTNNSATDTSSTEGVFLDGFEAPDARFKRWLRQQTLRP